MTSPIFSSTWPYPTCFSGYSLNCRQLGVFYLFPIASPQMWQLPKQHFAFHPSLCSSPKHKHTQFLFTCTLQHLQATHMKLNPLNLSCLSTLGQAVKLGSAKPASGCTVMHCIVLELIPQQSRGTMSLLQVLSATTGSGNTVKGLQPSLDQYPVLCKTSDFTELILV